MIKTRRKMKIPLLSRTAFVFNVAKWKRDILKNFLSEYSLRFLPIKSSLYEKDLTIRLSNNPIFIVWGCRQPDDLEDYAKEHDIPIYRIEDGFIRSIGLGSEHTLPYSLCLDKTGIYFDSTKSSDLEDIILNYSFKENKQLLKKAQDCLDIIRKNGISKYNEAQTYLAPDIYGPKISKRILVIGQVEDDQSLLYGCKEILTNAELISLAAKENPGAQIIYKTHPDYLAGKRKEISNINDIPYSFEIIPISISLKDALHDVDQVYTQSSLSGFEALIHGVKVTTTGAPFYSGWGLTDDRQYVDRRNKKISLIELFAAAYILYPRYINPENGKKIYIDDVLEIFIENISTRKIESFSDKLKRLELYNYVTGNPVSARYIYNSTTDNIAVISDTLSHIDHYRDIINNNKNLSFITTRDALANDESLILNSEESERIAITSIHKKYGKPFSQLEDNSVKLANLFAEQFKNIIENVIGNLLDKNVIKELSLGLEDYIYFESLRFYATQESLNEFGKIILSLNETQKNLDIIKSYYYHSKKENREGSLYIHHNNGLKEFIKETTQKKPPNEIKTNKEEINSRLNSLIWDIKLSLRGTVKNKHISICGNISNHNYAYSPASLKILKSVSKNKNNKIIFYPSNLTNRNGFNEDKDIILSDSEIIVDSVYEMSTERYKKDYKNIIEKSTHLICSELFEAFIIECNKKIPNEIIDIFHNKLKKFFERLVYHFIFICEVEENMENSSLFITSMDRSYISRILASSAKSKKVKTLAIQPQIISTSKRYKPSSVDVIGVIDSLQAYVYEQNGTPRDKIKKIGSTNISLRLSHLENVSAYKYHKEKTIFFAMQHSNQKNMCNIARSLSDICKKEGFRLIVKPHPHQETFVLNKVKKICSSLEKVTFLSKECDTYKYGKNADVIVGFFSSVLLEFSLYKKDVIIAAFEDIDESVDFSKMGLTLKAQNPSELYKLIISLIEEKKEKEELIKKRNEYLNNNNQFSKPYNTKAIENFITSHHNNINLKIVETVNSVFK